MNLYFLRPFWVAWQFLTIFPSPRLSHFQAGDEEKAIAWYPVIGLGVGGLTAGIFIVVSALMPEVPRLPVLMALLTNILITGALHIDGVADAADGLFSGQPDKDRKLTIMKDSRIGTMGALALLFFILIRLEVLSVLPFTHTWKILLLEPITGKLAIWLSMKHMPYIRINSKLKTRFINVIPSWIYTLGVIGILGSGVIILGSIQGVVLGLTLLGFNALYLFWIKRQLGGVTGDMYGTVNELNGVVLGIAVLLMDKLIL